MYASPSVILWYVFYILTSYYSIPLSTYMTLFTAYIVQYFAIHKKLETLM